MSRVRVAAWPFIASYHVALDSFVLLCQKKKDEQGEGDSLALDCVRAGAGWLLLGKNSARSEWRSS